MRQDTRPIDNYYLPKIDVPEAFDTSNRPDEWKIEQGMAGHKLPILDQTGSDTIHIYPTHPPKRVKDEEAIKSVGDRDKVFARELEGWKGYVVLLSYMIDPYRKKDRMGLEVAILKLTISF